MAERPVSPPRRKGSFFSATGQVPPGSPKVSDAKLSDLKNVMLTTIEFITITCDEMFMLTQSVQTMEMLVSSRKKLTLVANMKKILREFKLPPEATPPEVVMDPTFPEKVVLFRENMEFALWEIRSKVNLIKDLANSSDLTLDKAIRCARPIRQLKKLIESADEEEIEEPSGSLRKHRSLYVKVAEGKELKPMGVKGRTDAFVEIVVDDEVRAQTPTIYKDQNPVWLQEYTLPIPSSLSELQLLVCHEGVLSNEPIGYIPFSIEELVKEGKAVENWYDLEPFEARRDMGSIHIRCNYDADKPSIEVSVIQAFKIGKNPDAYVKVKIGDKKQKSKNSKAESPIWKESFEFAVPSDADYVEISVWDTSIKKTFLGEVRIPFSLIILDTTMSWVFESWFKLQPKRPKKTLGQIRLKLQYTELSIVPYDAYSKLVNLLLSNNFRVALELGKITNASQNIVSAIVDFFFTHQKAAEFLKVALAAEIAATDDPKIIFRSNSVASKGLDHFMKISGFPYLKASLAAVIESICNSKKSCEIDPSRLEKTDKVEKNRENLILFTNQVWTAIRSAIEQIPTSFRTIFGFLREKVLEKWPTNEQNVKYTSVSGMIFLRYFVPALLSPKQFNLMKDHPSGDAARNLTLIGKSLMTLANFAEFGQKEAYMLDLNQLFVDPHRQEMMDFIDNITQASSKQVTYTASGIEREIAVASIVQHLKENLEKLREKHPEEQQFGEVAAENQKLAVMVARLEASRTQTLPKNYQKRPKHYDLRRLSAEFKSLGMQ